MNKYIAFKANTSVELKNRIRLMRSAIIKKAMQDEQQNQTKTTNINYIQNFMSISKQLKNKVKIASNKAQSKQNNLQFNRKDMEPVHDKTR